MNIAIVVAIVALVSTIVGATIGAVTNYILALRRERSDKARDDRNHAVEVKRAARLIDLELSRAEAAAHICVEKRHWWRGGVPQLSTEAWQEYKGTLALDLTDEAWVALFVGIHAVVDINKSREGHLAIGLEGPISDATADTLAPMLRDIKLGRAALAPFARDSLPVTGPTTNAAVIALDPSSRRITMRPMSEDAKPDDSQLKLYGLLVDQLQKYNSLIWQAPTALIAANILALDKLEHRPFPLFAVCLFNGALIFAFCKMVMQQRAIITATQSAEAQLRRTWPEFIPTFTSTVRAPILFAWTLALLDAWFFIYCFVKMIG